MEDMSNEIKINQLSEKVASLTNQVNEQSGRLTSLEKTWSDQLREIRSALNSSMDANVTTVMDGELMRESRSSLVDSGSFMARLASICFILVIALILRTMTDSGFIGAEWGSKIGAVYAFFLIAIGWWMLKQKQSLGPIFPICGAFLLYTLVLETHARFDVYTSITAYSILLFTLLPLVILGKRYQLSFFHGVGLLGASCTAFAIDFPNPDFSQLAFFLFAANVISFSIEHQKTRWAKILLYAMTLLFWFYWTAKLHAPIVKGMEISSSVALPWFLPITVLTTLTLMGFSAHVCFRRNESLPIFDTVLPTINVLWLFTVCSLVIVPWQGSALILGYNGFALAIVNFIVGWAIYKFSRQDAPGISAFVFAGTTLMVMATLAIVQNVLIALASWSVVAVILCVISGKCGIGGIRLTSYLLQCVTTFLGICYGVLLTGATVQITSLFIAGFLVIMSGFQYYWCRKHLPVCRTGFFTFVDPKDNSAVVLLLAALVNGFCMLQMAAYSLLTFYTKTPGNAMLGAQSILINIGAIGLMVFGLRSKNREVLYMAIGVVVIGALKALGYDLLKVHGIPLVLSVFSFGVVAAVGSIVLSRWSKIEH